MARRQTLILTAAALAALSAGTLLAQQAPPATPAAPAGQAPAAGRGRGPQAPQFVSPEVSADRRITFRLLAPQAQSVRLTGSDITGLGQTGVFSKGENGVWSVTVGPVEPGAYRYNFNVDGVAVIECPYVVDLVEQGNRKRLTKRSGNPLPGIHDLTVRPSPRR